MVVAVGGCCGGGRIGSLWVGIGQGLGQIWWVCGCFGGGKDFQWWWLVGWFGGWW